jgi:hypothetical protein
MTLRTRRLDGRVNWWFVLTVCLIGGFWLAIYFWLRFR